ncbi:MAG: hypothetical protein GEU81_11380 [Nitriliruptorales bacterium]|nr:hypothetical protein [Nitriliruptorales bacterium]
MTLTLEAGTANVVAQLLELLAELPSTPEFVANEAHEHLGTLEEALPPPRRQHDPGARRLGGTVILGEVPATAIAGLLELLAELPSTPPAVSGEARAHAERLWAALDEATQREC